MENAKIWKQFYRTVELLFDLIPEGNATIMNADGIEEEYSFLVDTSHVLNYAELDSLYNNDFSPLENRGLSECEKYLVCGVSLLTEYGLSEDELDSWICAQKLYLQAVLYPLIGKIPSDEQQEAATSYMNNLTVEDYLHDDFSLEPRNGMEIVSEKNSALNATEKQFRFLENYVIFHSEFDLNQECEWLLKAVFGDKYEEYCAHLKETVTSYNCLNEFDQTLIAIVNDFGNCEEDVLKELTSNLRKNRVEPLAIQSFRDYFHQKSLEYKTGIASLLSPVVDFYENYYPLKEHRSHGYLNYLAELKELDLNAGVNNLKSLTDNEKDILSSVNSAVVGTAKNVVGSLIDGFLTMNKEVEFGIKIKSIICSDEFLSSIWDILDCFRNEITEQYKLANKTQDIDIIDYEMDGSRSGGLEQFCYDLDIPINLGDVRNLLLDDILDVPYDPQLYVYSYLIFGDNAGDLDAIADYLHISENFSERIEQAWEELASRIKVEIDGAETDLKRLGDLAEKLIQYKGFHARWSARITFFIDSIRAIIGRDNYCKTHDTSLAGENHAYYEFLETVKNSFRTIHDTVCPSLYEPTHKSFKERYDKLVATIDQGLFGPIDLIYRDLLAFTPEKLFLLKDWEIVDSFDYFELKAIDPYDYKKGFWADDTVDRNFELRQYKIQFTVQCGSVRFFESTLNRLIDGTAKQKSAHSESVVSNAKSNATAASEESASEENNVYQVILEELKKIYTLSGKEQLEAILSMAKGQKIIDDSLKIKDNDFPGADELLPVLVPLIGYSALLLHYNELPLINRTPIFDRYRIEKDYIIDLLNGLNLLEKSGVEYILGKQYKSNSYHAQQLEMVLESLPTEAYLFNLEHPIAHIFQDKNKPIDEQYQQIKQIAIDAGLFGGDFRLLPDEKQIKADFRLIVMPILANLALKLKFGAIPKALNVNDLNHALSNKQSIVDILEKHDILIAENGCYLLNHFYDSSFENKGSYAYNVRWLWTEINIEIEYQSKLAKAHGLKRLLIEKPEHRL